MQQFASSCECVFAGPLDHVLPRHRAGNFSNDDGDGNEDVKKGIGLLRKTTTLHVNQAFFVHFYTSLARPRREIA